ncbi:hypothetical protein CN354_02290 [Bacillus cereus]|nr:hypothetical protein CN354_02290 [Bacillus cereus]WJE53520.1 hypothetical protein QRE66_04355 [Bacillus cereus]
MNAVAPDAVHFIDAVSVEGNVKSISGILSNWNNEKQHHYAVPLLENVMDWVMNSNSKAYEISE